MGRQLACSSYYMSSRRPHLTALFAMIVVSGAPIGTAWLNVRFDPRKATPGYRMSPDGVTAPLASGKPSLEVATSKRLGFIWPVWLAAKTLSNQ